METSREAWVGVLLQFTDMNDRLNEQPQCTRKDGAGMVLLELVEHNATDILGDTNLTGCSFCLDKEFREAL